jgi:hypothetical protein
MGAKLLLSLVLGRSPLGQHAKIDKLHAVSALLLTPEVWMGP